MKTISNTTLSTLATFYNKKNQSFNKTTDFVKALPNSLKDIRTPGCININNPGVDIHQVSNGASSLNTSIMPFNHNDNYHSQTDRIFDKSPRLNRDSAENVKINQTSKEDIYMISRILREQQSLKNKDQLPEVNTSTSASLPKRKKKIKKPFSVLQKSGTEEEDLDYALSKHFSRSNSSLTKGLSSIQENGRLGQKPLIRRMRNNDDIIDQMNEDVMYKTSRNVSMDMSKIHLKMEDRNLSLSTLNKLKNMENFGILPDEQLGNSISKQSKFTTTWSGGDPKQLEAQRIMSNRLKNLGSREESFKITDILEDGRTRVKSIKSIEPLDMPVIGPVKPQKRRPFIDEFSDIINQLDSLNFFFSLGKIDSDRNNQGDSLDYSLSKSPRNLDKRRINLKDKISKVQLPNSTFGEDEMVAETPFVKILIEELRRDLPNVLSNVPSDRKEVLILREWLEKGLKTIFKSQETHTREKLMIADELFNISLNELIRQISFNCLERAELFLDIWQSYFVLFRKLFSFETSQRIQLRDTTENECLKVTKIYREKLTKKDEELKEAKNKIEQIREELLKIKVDQNEVFAREKRLKDQIETHKGVIQSLKARCYALMKENHEQFCKIEKYKDQDEVNNYNRQYDYQKPNKTHETSVVQEKLNTESSEKNNKTIQVDDEENDEDYKELMNLLGEGETDEKNELDNYIIIKNTYESKEKVVFNKQTEIDWEFRARNSKTAEIQADLTLLDKKYDSVMNKQSLDDYVQELMIKKDIISVNTNERRASSIYGKNSFLISDNTSPRSNQKRVTLGVAESTEQNPNRGRKSILDFLNKVNPIVRSASSAHEQEEEQPIVERKRFFTETKRKINVPELKVTTHMDKDLLQSLPQKESPLSSGKKSRKTQESSTPLLKVDNSEAIHAAKRPSLILKTGITPISSKTISIPSRGDKRKKSIDPTTIIPISILKSPGTGSDKKASVRKSTTIKDQALIKAIGDVISKGAGKPSVGNPKKKKLKKSTTQKVEPSVKDESEGKSDLEDTFTSDESLIKLDDEDEKEEMNDNFENFERVDSIEVLNSVENVEHVKPVVHINHIEPVEHIKHIEPIEHVKHFELIKQVEPLKHVEHIEHVEQIEHVEAKTENNKNTEITDNQTPQEMPNPEENKNSNEGGRGSIQEERKLHIPIPIIIEPVQVTKTEASPKSMKTNTDPDLPKGRVSFREGSYKQEDSPLSSESLSPTSKSTIAKIQNLLDSGKLSNSYLRSKFGGANNTTNVEKEDQMQKIKINVTGYVGMQAEKALHEDDEEIQNHIMELINMFQIENRKFETVRDDHKKIRELILELLNFTKRLMQWIKDRLITTYHDDYSNFNKTFIGIRQRMPKDIDPNFEDEMRENIIRRRMIKKTKNITKFFSVPKLGFLNKPTITDKATHSGIVLSKKIREKGGGALKRFKNFMPMKNVLKLITQLYEEKMLQSKETVLIKEQELEIFVFNQFLNRYGIKKVAEQKFTLFCISVLHNIHIFRINLFAKMLNLLDEKLNSSLDEVKKYMEGYEFLLYTCTSGTPIVHIESNQKRYIPFVRCLDYLKIFSDQRMSIEEMAEMKRDVDAVKENDPKGINKLGIVDMDSFLAQILTKYRYLMNRTKTYVVNAFKAADLDGNKMCNLSEFVILYRHIESNKFLEEQVIKMFEESADLVTDTEKNMSFDKFVAICVDYNLFSDERQNLFLGIKDASDIDYKFKRMKDNWLDLKSSIEKKLIDMKQHLDGDEYQNWENILETLDKRVGMETSSEPKPILIAYKVMENELLRLVAQKELHEHDLAELSEDEPEQIALNSAAFKSESMILSLEEEKTDYQPKDNSPTGRKQFLNRRKSERTLKLKRSMSKKIL